MSNIKDAPISGESLAAVFAALPAKLPAVRTAEIVPFMRKDDNARVRLRVKSTERGA